MDNWVPRVATRSPKVRTIAAAVIALVAPAVSARADAPSDLQAKIRTALRAAPSFVETIKVKPNALAPLGGTMTYTVVAPNRFHQVVTGLPGGSDDTIIVGHEIYGPKGKGWSVQTWDDRLVTGFEGDIFNVEVVSVGPDQTVDGKTVGTFVMKDPRGSKPSDTLACSYEKATSRPLSCNNALFAIEYSRYGDPSVTIETPKNAVRVDR